jgi:hypothetical protein
MAKYKLQITLVLLALISTGATLAAIDSAYRSAPEIQLIEEDKALDSAIQKTILEIEKLHELKNLSSLHMSPQQTKVRVQAQGQCITVDAHSENHEMRVVKSAPVDYKSQNIQLCYENNKLTRIESAFTSVSQTKGEKTVNNLIHRDPANSAVNDIVLSSAFNELSKDTLRVGDLQNTFTQPMRIAFKRDYYLPHLRNTAYIMRRTLEMHQQEAIKLNRKTVNHYSNYAQ